MTFQTADQQTAAEFLRPHRPLIALLLLGAAGLQLLRTYWVWLVSSGQSPSFDLRSFEAAGQFTSVPALTLPLLAVLITTMVAPVVGQAKTITLIALGEYALTVLGALSAAVAGIAAVASHPGGVLVSILIDRLVMLTLLGVAVFVVLRIYLGMYVKAAPTVAYGGGYPVQSYPGYGQQAYQQPAAAPYAAQHAQAATAQQAQAVQQAQAAQHTTQQQYGTPYGNVQAPPTQQAPYGYGPQTGQYPTGSYQTTPPHTAPPPTSVPPAPAAESATGSEQEQPATQQQVRPASGWPPAPASPWPPALTSGGAASGSTADDPSKTQMFRPEQYRGNTPG